MIAEPWWPPCNLSTQEIEARGLGVQDQPWLHAELKVNVDYMRPCLNL